MLSWILFADIGVLNNASLDRGNVNSLELDRELAESAEEEDERDLWLGFC